MYSNINLSTWLASSFLLSLKNFLSIGITSFMIKMALIAPLSKSNRFLSFLKYSIFFNASKYFFSPFWYLTNTCLATSGFTNLIISVNTWIEPIDPPLASAFEKIASATNLFAEGSCLNFISPPVSKIILISLVSPLLGYLTNLYGLQSVTLLIFIFFY